MKKSSVTIAVTIIIITALGLAYIGNSYLKRNDAGSSRVEDKQNDSETQQVSYETTSGEYKYTLPDNEIITAEFLKTGNTIKIYAVYPVDDKSKYNISQSGDAAVYLGRDGHIWALYNNGTYKKITPDKYESIEKSLVQKENPNYIWAEKPEITYAGTIHFVSNLPDTSPSPKKSIWDISMENGVMRKIYTMLADSYNILGYRDDGKLLVLDGDIIAAVDLNDASVNSIDVKGKNITGISPDGTKILFANKNNGNKLDAGKLYVMDSYGKNITPLPWLEGYSPTAVGEWAYSTSEHELRYAYVMKPNWGGREKIAVISFEEGFIGINAYTPDANISLSNSSKLKWSSDDIISIDTGEDIVSVELK